MFRPIIAATAILFALTGTTVSANPKKAPDIAPRILKELEIGKIVRFEKPTRSSNAIG